MTHVAVGATTEHENVAQERGTMQRAATDEVGLFWRGRARVRM
jgi:hypothetical protein